MITKEQAHVTVDSDLLRAAKSFKEKKKLSLSAVFNRALYEFFKERDHVETILGDQNRTPAS